MFLWRTGLRVFLDSPIIGIGLGQVGEWDQFLSFWRFDIASLATRGLGAHNDFITYIAETGLLGIAPLMWFLWRMFATGGQALRRVSRHDEAAKTMTLWIPVAAMVMGFFFRTHMFYSIAGILTSLYFAFWIKYYTPLEYPRTDARTTIAESAG
jgi:O-antigen ligase